MNVVEKNNSHFWVWFRTQCVVVYFQSSMPHMDIVPFQNTNCKVKWHFILASEFGKTNNWIIEALISYINLPNEKGVGQVALAFYQM